LGESHLRHRLPFQQRRRVRRVPPVKAKAYDVNFTHRPSARGIVVVLRGTGDKAQAWKTRPQPTTTTTPRGKRRSRATSPSSWPSTSRRPTPRSTGNKRMSSSTRNSPKSSRTPNSANAWWTVSCRSATRDGGEQWVYIHVEVQGQRDANFPERLFTYNYRLYDRYRRPVASLAVLADEGRRLETHPLRLSTIRLRSRHPLPDGQDSRLRRPGRSPPGRPQPFCPGHRGAPVHPPDKR
jgi:hypothetical protein